ncbi:hypothetical protein AEAC466_10740 [Asticcacaulis sp. AC466]|nr:hypothetical protein AEAC466_10740 [Asticcacaulis sp. AC466]
MNFHGFSKPSKETVMTKFDHETEDLIDLGHASVETKGNQTIYAPDEVAQHLRQPGLSND